jgi:hypothetical protein
MSAYDRQIKLAQRLIKQKGAAVVWIQNPLTQDNAEPWKTSDAGEPGKFDVSILFIRPDSSLHRTLYALLKRTEIATGIQRGIMASVPFTPGLNDKVTLNGKQMNVSKFDVFAPSGLPILYYIEFN